MKTAPLVIHGWTVFAHPLFMAQVETLAKQVETHKQNDPNGYFKKNATKRLAAIAKLAFDVIPQDPRKFSALGSCRKAERGMSP